MGVHMSVYYHSRLLIIKEGQGSEKTSQSESPRLKKSQMEGANSLMDPVNKEVYLPILFIPIVKIRYLQSHRVRPFSCFPSSSFDTKRYHICAFQAGIRSEV